MFDTIRFLRKVRYYHKVARLPFRKRFDIAMRRLERLKALAVERVPFYGARDAGKQYLPVINKDQYVLWPLAERLAVPHAMDMAKFARDHLAVHAGDTNNLSPILPFRFEGEDYLVYTTSGTTGGCVQIIQRASYLEDLVALQMARGSAEPKTLLNCWNRFCNPLRWATLLRGPGAFPGITLMANRPAVSKRFTDQLTLDISTGNMGVVQHHVEKHNPTIITTYPSQALLMAQEDWHLPSLRLVVCMSEPLTQRIKQAVSQAWPDVVVANHYAMGECPILTCACPHGHGAHVNDDVALLLPMDQSGRVTKDGYLSHEVIVSDLLNDVQPILNYKMDDQLAINGMTDDDHACTCGSRQPLIFEIKGRQSDALALPSGVILSNLQARALVAKYPDVLDYQFVLDENTTHLMMRVVISVPKSHFPSNVLVNELETITKVACRVHMVPFIPIEKGAQKAKRFVVKREVRA